MIRRLLKSRRWRRDVAFTPSEITVVRALLPRGDLRSVPLFAQAQDAPGVQRALPNDWTCVVTIPYVKDERHAIDALSEHVSPVITVNDALSGRRLAFSIKVKRGGFLNELVGVAADTSAWPKDWRLDADGTEAILSQDIENWLPRTLTQESRLQIIRALAIWCGCEADRLTMFGPDMLTVRMPATPDELAAAESRLRVRLPGEYREFVAISNGLAIRHGRPYDIFGTSDVERLDIRLPGGAHLVVTDLYEEGVAALQCGGEGEGSVVFVGPHSAEPELVGSLRRHVWESLTWLESLGDRT